ncbi:MAG: response regulator [Methanobacterium sp.]
MGSKILIVEDEFITVMDLEIELKKRGFKVEMVSRGIDAIQKVEEFKPDLVLMDITLPGEMNGIEAAKHIVTKFSIPLIFLTAHSDKTTLEQIESIQNKGLVTKPFESDFLLKSIEIALAK